jgi:hypothetical protein
MYSSQSTRARSLLGLGGTAAVGSFGTGQDAAGGEDQDMAIGEFLFEFAGEALLNLVEAWKEGDRDEYDDGFLAVADFDLEEGAVSSARRISRCISRYEDLGFVLHV